MSDRETSGLRARIAGLSPEKRALLASRLNSAATSPAAATREPIAVVGLACRFPGANDAEQFWRVIRNGTDTVTEVPADRWNVDALYDPDASAVGKVATRWGGFLDGIDQFDAAFFGISPREAVRMDPQQRLLLEVAWHAFENAGQTHQSLAGSLTGVFVGIHSHSNDYAWLQRNADAVDMFTSTGTAHNFMSGRVSYLFDLQGPSLVVDTACSSSLVAVHLACQSLLATECRMALVAGVNAQLTADSTIAGSRMHMLSPVGRCKAFDASADGFVRSEGCGAVVLKRLSDATADGDRVLAVIRGSAINQDGRTNGITAPSGRAQQAVIREALRCAGVGAEQVSYVEAHGTGTPLGDPIEVESLAAVYGAMMPSGTSCALGSIKANVGHLEGAAGIAGLIKAILCLQHGVVPPVALFRALNPHIAINGTRLEIPTTAREWTVANGRRFAGVSSFGWSGTNVHAILEDAPVPNPVESTSTSLSRASILTVSAASPDALRAVAEQYAEWLESEPAPALNDVLASAALRRTHFDERLAIVGESSADMSRRLRAYCSAGADSGVVTGRVRGDRAGLVFVFPGQGSQWLGMGRQLLATEPVFRAALEQCDRAIAGWTGWSIVDELRASPDSSRLAQIDVVQPTLFAIQVALAALWRAWGIESDVVVGHSMGEIAAAHVAGALTLEDATRVICRRSALMKRISGHGAMAMVELSLDEARKALAGYQNRLAIAVSNGPRTTVVSGDPDAVHELMDTLERQEVFCRSIKVDVASHSPQVDPLLADLEAALAGIRPSSGSIPMYSTVVNRLVDGAELDAAYWTRNLREPVLFSSAVDRLSSEGNLIFVEVGPHPILVPAIEAQLQESHVEALVVASMRREEDERSVLLEAVARLFCAGRPIRWDRLVPSGRFVAGPAYPFQRERFWLEPSGAPRSQPLPFASAQGGHPLLGPGMTIAAPAGTRVWHPTLDGGRHPFLLEHRLGGLPMLSAAVSIELFLAAAADLIDTRAMLSDVVFERPLTLDSSALVQIVAEPTGPETWTCALFARTANGEWVRHTAAHISADNVPSAATSRAHLSAPSVRGGDDFYRSFGKFGVEMGPSLQTIAEVSVATEGVQARLAVSDRVRREATAFRVHPALLDGAFQATAGLEACSVALHVTARIATVRLTRPHQESVVDVRAHGSNGSVCDIWVSEPETGVGVELTGVELREPAGLPGLAKARDLRDCLYHVDWVPCSRPASSERASSSRRSGTWILFRDQIGVGDAIARCLERSGAHVVSLADDTDIETAVGAIQQSGEELHGVVHLWSVDQILSEHDHLNADEQIELATTRTIGSAIRLVRALASREWAVMPRVWLVTSGAAGPCDQPTLSGVSQAPLWGFGRVLATEHRELWGGLIDVQTHDPAAAGTAVFDEIWNCGDADEVAIRGSERLVPRLLPWRPRDVGQPVVFRADARYVVAGGLGDVGLAVARWAAEAGARHLVLVGRRGLPERVPGAQLPDNDRRRIDAVAALEQLGCTVDVVAADIGNRDALTTLVNRLRADGMPIRGVLHCAAAIDDRLIRDLDLESVRRVMHAKVHGGWLLHEAFADAALDFFVLFSSGGALLGQVGQASYAAANCFLDALAHLRRASGRRALSVNWGAWRGLGFAATAGGQRTVQALEASGMASFDAAEGCAALEWLLQHDATQVAVLPTDWTAFRAGADRQLLAGLTAPPSDSGVRQQKASASLASELVATPIEQRRALLESHLQRHLGAVLKLPAAKIEPLRPLGTLGLESLLALEFRNRLERDVALRLPATMVWNHPTVRALSTYVAERLGIPLDAAPASSRPADEPTQSPRPMAVDELSDEQALQALLGAR